MCENAEAKIRIEFAKQLDSQLDTIADLREKLKQAEEEKKNAIENARITVSNAQDAINNAVAEQDKISKEVVDLTDKLNKCEVQIENDKEIIELLKDKSNKYEADSIAYQEAKSTIESLTMTITELKDNIKDNNNEHVIKLKEIELNHAQETADIKANMQSIINAKELEIANIKADADKNYYEAQQKWSEKQQKYIDELHDLKSQNKDLMNELEKLKDKLSKFEAEKESKKEEKKQSSPNDEDGEQLSLL